MEIFHPQYFLVYMGKLINNRKKFLYTSTLIVLSIHIVFLFYTNFCLITSESMYPTFWIGDVVLTYNITTNEAIKKGDLVVFKVENSKKKYVKRIAAFNIINGDTICYVLGDNVDNSYDSRNYGWIPKENITQKVKLILWSWDEKNNKLRTDRILKKVD